MKSTILIMMLGWTTIAHGKNVKLQSNSIIGYLQNSIKIAEEIRKTEAESKSNYTRITGGVPAATGQYPWQAGLIIDIIDISGKGICGASVLSNYRLVTAAHCWFDGQNQAWRFTVVLGSIKLFSDGHRIQTSVVKTHPDWNPSLIRNDIAIINLPFGIIFSETIAPIALPSNEESEEDFAGAKAIATGYGITENNATYSDQTLNHVRLKVITNKLCSIAFPLFIQSSNICTSGLGGVSTCNGDSGGPLTLIWNDEPILIGVTSFGSIFGCQANMPAVFTRITSYFDFLKENMT